MFQSLLIWLLSLVTAGTPVVIKEQGAFTVGGTMLQRPGVYDNAKFVGWSEQIETGQSYRADHAFVDYQIPVRARKNSLIFIHGFGGDGVVWQMTPDGRPGFATLMLEKRWPIYIVDLPGRGRAGRTTATTTTKPVADEMFWFDIWRIGVWPEYNPGVQFPMDAEYLSQFFRQMTPDLSNHTLDADAATEIANTIGNSILVTHSAGGMPGWIAAMNSDAVRGVAAYEPGGFVFPDDDMPDKIDGLTGGVAPVGVPREQFMKLTKIPIVMYFGDYIPDIVSDKLGDENWRVRLAMARKFADAINKNGGNATLIELPKIGIHGNTHFLMQDLNNAQLADLLNKWLKENKLTK